MDRQFLAELFARFGAVDIRSMFGGYGLSADGLTFGLVSGDHIHLKVDDVTRARFEAEGCVPFSVMMKGRPKTIPSYWRIPERLYDDPDQLAEWAREAYAAARRISAADGANTLRKAKPTTNARTGLKPLPKARRPR